MESKRVEAGEELPEWVMAFGPFVVFGVAVIGMFAAVNALEFEFATEVGLLGALVWLTAIGFVAGILPVAIGMLWFPYVRRLDPAWIHAVLALSAGILAFIAVEMADEALAFGAEVEPASLGAGVVAVGAIGTLVLMEIVSRWRKRKATDTDADGLRVAYLVAIGLGLHSIGEGLAIGSAFAVENLGLVVLLTLGFLVHNVTEGPAVIAALARERTVPPIRHFVALGVIAGGGVILGGWIGSIVDSPLLAAAFFAIALGAILQVVWEMIGLVRRDAGRLFTRRIAVAFVVGVFVMFFLEEIVVDAWLL